MDHDEVKVYKKEERKFIAEFAKDKARKRKTEMKGEKC